MLILISHIGNLIKMIMKIFIVVIIALLVGSFSSCNTSSSSSSSKSNKITKKDKGEDAFDKYLESKKAKLIGKPIPSRILYTINGKQYNPSKMSGKIVLLNFWFSACKPCITEIPSLNELQSKYKSKGLVVLSVSTDSKTKATEIAKDKKMKYEVAYSGAKFAEEMKVTSYPTTFLIDKKGIIRDVFIGASSFDATQTYSEIKPSIEKILQK